MAKTDTGLLQKLKELEPIIKGEARQCPNFLGLQALEDLEQIGRMELLKVLSEKGSDFDTNYYRMTVRYAMQQAATTKYNRKSLLGGEHKHPSFDAEGGIQLVTIKPEDGVRSDYIKDLVLRLERETARDSRNRREQLQKLVIMLIRDTYNYSYEQAKQNVTSAWLRQNGLETTCNQYFNDDIEEMITYAFANNDTEDARQDYRQKTANTAEIIAAMKAGNNYDYIKKLQATPDPKTTVRSLFHEIITGAWGYTVERAVEIVDYKWFVEQKLAGLLWVFYRNSPRAALIDIFGDEMENPYAMKLPQEFWQGEGGKQRAAVALTWFAKHKKITDKSQCRRISRQDFIDAGLGYMLQIFFRDSSYLAMQTLFPCLMPWETKIAKSGTYNTETTRLVALDAYLLATLGTYIQTLSAEEVYRLGIRSKISRASIENFGLRGLLAKYDNQAYKLFSTHYPTQILPWSIERKNQFTQKNPRAYARAALKWLFEDYFLLTPEELPGVLSCALLWQIGFSGIMSNPKVGLNSSTFAAADLVYPGRFEPKDFSCRRGRAGELSYHLVHESLDMRKWRKKK